LLLPLPLPLQVLSPTQLFPEPPELPPEHMHGHLSGTPGLSHWLRPQEEHSIASLPHCRRSRVDPRPSGVASAALHSAARNNGNQSAALRLFAGVRLAADFHYITLHYILHPTRSGNPIRSQREAHRGRDTRRYFTDMCTAHYVTYERSAEEEEEGLHGAQCWTSGGRLLLIISVS
jgi:hypothetical protein